MAMHLGPMMVLGLQFTLGFASGMDASALVQGKLEVRLRHKDPLPEGWESALDPRTGNEYFWPLSDRQAVTWQRPKEVKSVALNEKADSSAAECEERAKSLAEQLANSTAELRRRPDHELTDILKSDLKTCEEAHKEHAAECQRRQEEQEAQCQAQLKMARRFEEVLRVQLKDQENVLNQTTSRAAEAESRAAELEGRMKQQREVELFRSGAMQQDMGMGMGGLDMAAAEGAEREAEQLRTEMVALKAQMKEKEAQQQRELESLRAQSLDKNCSARLESATQPFKVVLERVEKELRAKEEELKTARPCEEDPGRSRNLAEDKSASVARRKLQREALLSSRAERCEEDLEDLKEVLSRGGNNASKAAERCQVELRAANERLKAAAEQPAPPADAPPAAPAAPQEEPTILMDAKRRADAAEERIRVLEQEAKASAGLQQRWMEAEERARVAEEKLRNRPTAVAAPAALSGSEMEAQVRQRVQELEDELERQRGLNAAHMRRWMASEEKIEALMESLRGPGENIPDGPFHAHAAEPAAPTAPPARTQKRAQAAPHVVEAALKPGWRKVWSEADKGYYYWHVASGNVTWDRP